MISDYIYQIYIAILSALVAGVTWLIRRVLTNQAEIALLQQEIKTRDLRRDEDREILLRLEGTVDKLRNDLQSQILDLYKQK
jgi:hypothetical protein